MGVTELLSKLEALGVVLRPEGDRILFRPRGAVPPDLLAGLRVCKRQLLEYLSWPPEAAETPGTELTRLLPLVGRRVRTPEGLGDLVAILPGFVRVKLPRVPQGIASFLPYEVEALGSPAQQAARPGAAASSH